MIMSYYTNLEMSAFKDAIMHSSRGGHYGRKGHYQDERKGVKKITNHSQDNQ